MNTPFSLGLLIGVLSLIWQDASAARTHRGTRLPMPTRETIPLVAEAMGATTYQESVEEEDSAGSSSRRVQRKLNTEPREDVDSDQEFMEYQGVMGRPGVDFPVLPSIPRTAFSCRNVKSSGYYADLDTGCQVFHICDGGRKISFLCPNGTIFRQSHLICDWWFRVDCGRSVELYEESAEQLAHDQMIYKKRAEALAKAMEKGPGRSEEERSRATNNNRERYQDEGQSRLRQEKRLREEPYRATTEAYERNTVTAQTQGRRRQRPTSTTPNYPQYNPKNRLQEPERQIPAETASFASNSRHRFANQVVNQHNSFRTTVRPETSTGYWYPVSTTPFPPSSLQPAHRFSTEAPVVTTTTVKPIFTVHVKPERDFSYVELHRNSLHKDQAQQGVYDRTPQTETFTVTQRPVFEGNVVSSTPYPKTSSPFAETSTFQPSTTQNFYGTQTTGHLPLNGISTTASPPLEPIHNITAYAPPVDPLYINSMVSDTDSNSENRNSKHLPSSGANTLLSLASYYGTSVSEPVAKTETTTKKTPQVSEILLRAHSGSPDTSPELDEVVTTVAPNVDIDNLTLVLTKATKDSYRYLFSDSKEQPATVNDTLPQEEILPKSLKEEIPPEDIEIEIDSQESGRIVGPITDNKRIVDDTITDLKLKHSHDFRELAQVFSRALSAYLEDPESFKEILAQVRPTEPNLNEITTPSPEDEVLDFSDAGQGREGSTDPPSNSLNESDIGNVNAGDINNLATSIRNLDEDNSVEQVTGVPDYEERKPKSYFTSTYPTSIAIDINNIVYNQSQIDTGAYYSGVGSAEVDSYFPTAGGVRDTSRPRYGGFQNNTFATPLNYSPYGSGLSVNVTGSPLSLETSTPKPEINKVQQNANLSTINLKIQNIPENLDIPEAQDVNSLVTSNNVYNSPTYRPLERAEALIQNTPSPPSLLQKEQDYFGSSGDQEKVLIASGSQSLVSGDNYVQLQNKQENSKDNKYGTQNDKGETLTRDISFTSTGVSGSDDVIKSQEHVKQNGFADYADRTKQPGDSGSRKLYSKSLVLESGVLDSKSNQHIDILPAKTNPVEESKNDDILKPVKAFDFSSQEATENPLTEDETSQIRYGTTYSDYDSEERNVTYQNVDLGNGVTLERTLKYTTPHSLTTTWTASYNVETTTLIPETTTVKEREEEPQYTTVRYSEATPGHVRPTTYHPLHISEVSAKNPEPEPTTQRTTSEGHFITKNYELSTDSYEAYTTTTSIPDPTTLPAETENFEEKAKEMFGGLNETAAGTLMEMMNKAESNMTIRRLVLLLVADKSRENRTAEETRASLIHALLNSEDSSEPVAESSTQPPTTTTTTTTTTVSPSPRQTLKRVRVSRVRTSHPSQDYRRGKSYRGTDSLTSVRGANNVQSSTELTNRINSARLFIPPSPKEKLPYDSDARAVELLKSLYNLAAKWG